MKSILKRLSSLFLVVFSVSSILTVSISAEGVFEPSKSNSYTFVHDFNKVFKRSIMEYNSSTSLFVSSLQISLSEYSSISSNGYYCIGTQFFPTSGSFSSYDSYSFILTLVPSAGNGFNTSDPSAYSAWASSLDSSNMPIVSGAKSLSYSPEITRDSSGAITFKFNDISYLDFMNHTFIYFQTDINKVTMYSEVIGGVPTATFYMMNMYLGLTSEFDEESYSKEVASKLEDIERELGNTNEKLDNIEGALNEVGNKVDEVGDQISGDLNDMQQSMETQHIKEEEYSKDKSDSAVEDVSGALDDSGLTPSIDDMWTGLKRLFSCLSTTETIQTIPIPEVKVPVLSGTGFDSEVVLIPDQDYDLSQILNNPSIQTLIKGAKVLYYLFFFYFMVDYLRKIFAKLFLTDVATNEAANVK